MKQGSVINEMRSREEVEGNEETLQITLLKETLQGDMVIFFIHRAAKMVYLL